MAFNIHIFSALLTSILMAAGQILCKLGAGQLDSNNLLTLIKSLVLNPFLVTAIGLYAATIILWIIVLKHLPLSTAYPIVAFSYAVVPFLSYYFLEEPITPSLVLGTGLIICGIATIHLKLF